MNLIKVVNSGSFKNTKLNMNETNQNYKIRQWVSRHKSIENQSRYRLSRKMGQLKLSSTCLLRLMIMTKKEVQLSQGLSKTYLNLKLVLQELRVRNYNKTLILILILQINQSNVQILLIKKHNYLYHQHRNKNNSQGQELPLLRVVD